MGDVFMNFLSIAHAQGAASNVLVETEVATGMTPFSSRPWGMSIALVEWVPRDLSAAALDATFEMALSTRQGMAAIPTLDDSGCIDKLVLPVQVQVEGITKGEYPVRHQFIPTVLVAAPKISFYTIADIDTAPFQATIQTVRLGFLTVEMTQQLWNEVAQTWALEA